MTAPPRCSASWDDTPCILPAGHGGRIHTGPNGDTWPARLDARPFGVADTIAAARVTRDVLIEPGFHGEIDVRYIDGRYWSLLADVIYCSPLLQCCLRVSAGTRTNFASIPRAFWMAMPPTDARIAPAAVIHDELYHDARFAITRAEADRVLVEAMGYLGAGWWARHVAYRVLRLFGGGFVEREQKP